MAVTGSITITQKSQNIANNTSDITVVGKAVMSGPSYDEYTREGSITIDGKKYTFTATFPSNSTKQLFSKTVTVSHGTDGKKTVSASFSIKTGMTGTLDNGVLTASTSKTLTTIPRASSVTCADGNIGSSTTININRATSSFTHTITYSFLGLTGTIATKTSNTSIGWTIPTSFYTKIPNATSGKGTITCQTYTGSTLIGTNTCTFNAFVINSDPTISGTVQDINQTTIALTGDNNQFIKYFSNAKVDIVANAKNSATISSRKVVCGNKTGTAASNTLNGVESGDFTISCIDSRGKSASKRISKTLIPYVKLAFTNMVLTRPSTTSNTINCKLQGNYFNKSFGQQNNTLNLKYRYREANGTWEDYISMTPNITGDSFRIEANLGDIFSFQSEYEFEFVAKDELMQITSIQKVSRGIPIIDIGKDDVVVNGELYNGRNKIIKIYTDLSQINSNLSWNTATTSDIYANMEDETMAMLAVELVSYQVAKELEFTDGLELIIYKSTPWRGMAIASQYHSINVKQGHLQTSNTLSWQNINKVDSGWINASLTNHFKPYNDNSYNIPQYRKIDQTVFIRGIVGPKSEVASGGSADIFTLPTGYRPSKSLYKLCQGSGKTNWLITIGSNGVVNFSRYGTNTNSTASTTVWLPFQTSFPTG